MKVSNVHEYNFLSKIMNEYTIKNLQIKNSDPLEKFIFMKKNLLFKLLAFAFFALFWGNANSQCLPQWQYAVPIEVSNSTSTPLFSFQVKVVVNTQDLIAHLKMNPDGSDIRFTTVDDCTLLPYWIESGLNTTTTTIWVKTPTIPAGGSQTIKMYYGNSSATAMSNGNATFDLFDDFLGTSLDATKWNTYKPGSSTVTVTGGKVTLKSLLGSADVVIRSVNTVPGPITVEANVTAATGNSPSLAILDQNTFGGYTMSVTSGNMNLGVANGGCSSYTNSSTVATSAAGSVIGTWGLQWPITDFQACYWPNGGHLSASSSIKNITTDVNVAAGGMCSGAQTMTIDWIRVRRYSSAEPGTTVGKEVRNDASITTSAVTGSPFCVGSPLNVSFTVTGTYNADNVFTAQLSDGSGNFTSPVNIGTLQGTAAGNISCSLPANASGNNYAIRVVSNSPAITGSVSTSSIQISARPVANAGQAQAICAGQIAYIGETATDGYTYSWKSSPAGFASAEANPRVNPSATTTYTVITSNSAGCKDSASVVITVNPKPAANAGTAQAICNGQSAYIGGAAVAGSTYSWKSSPAVFTSTEANPQVNPSATTTYTVIEKNTNGCVDSNSVVITVNPRPAANAGTAQAICNGQSVYIGGTAVTGSTYSWKSSPDGFTSTDANPKVSPSVTTTYTVVETNASGCSDSNSVVITVNPRPAANAGAEQSICVGQSAQIGGTAVAGSTYSWKSSPAGFTSTDANPVVKPSATTTYTVIEKNTNGCVDSNSVKVTVVPLPAANAGKNQVICAGTSIAIGATAVQGSTYSWTSYPSGFSSTSANPTVKPTCNTTYTLTETNANGCKNSNQVKVTVNAAPVASFSALPDVCSGAGAIVLKGGSPAGGKYSGDGVTNGIFDPAVAGVGDHDITYTVTNAAGCSGYAVSTITVKPSPAKPVITPSGDTTFCQGGGVVLTSSRGDYYTWSNDNGIICGSSRTLNVTKSGTYYVTVTSNGCASTSRGIKVTVNPAPTVNAGDDITYYLGYNDCPTLNASGNTNGLSYHWSTGATTKSIQVCPTTTTQYWVVVSNANCISSKSYVTVTVINVLCHDEEDYKGKDKNMNKVKICHNGNDICVDPSAVPNHLKHGDHLGSCHTDGSCGGHGHDGDVLNDDGSWSNGWKNWDWGWGCGGGNGRDDDDRDNRCGNNNHGGNHGCSVQQTGAGLNDPNAGMSGQTYNRQSVTAAGQDGATQNASSVALGVKTTNSDATLAERFEVYPNPFTTSSTVDLVFNKDQNITVDILSIDGKIVKTIFSGNVLSSTPYSFNIDGKDMTNGIYLVRVSNKDRIEYKKINLLKN
jgi:hypothetical protein